MTNIDLIPTQTNSALIAADGRSLIASALAWRVVDPVPDQMGQSIEALEGTLRKGLQPCPLDAYVVLLERLFTATERPRDDAVMLWRALLDHYPEGVFQRAVEHVIGHHKWAGPPKVAQLVEAASTDAEWADMKMAKLRMRTLKARWAQQQLVEAGERVPYNPEVEGVVQAAAYASQRAMVDRTNAEQAKAKAARQARSKPSPEEVARINAAARKIVGTGP